jgi:hypothetical protein
MSTHSLKLKERANSVRGALQRNSSISDPNAGVSTWKLVTDKFKIALASLDDLEVSIVKATNHDLVPPKEKHVRSMSLSVLLTVKKLFFLHSQVVRTKLTSMTLSIP